MFDALSDRIHDARLQQHRRERMQVRLRAIKCIEFTYSPCFDDRIGEQFVGDAFGIDFREFAFKKEAARREVDDAGPAAAMREQVQLIINASLLGIMRLRQDFDFPRQRKQSSSVVLTPLSPVGERCWG
ncbi:MAG: hypothetical protein U0744_09835 [Gemmataceae bacterium]